MLKDNIYTILKRFKKITINGNISDAQDLLPGVSILEKGTTNGTSSDIDGNFSIKINQKATLVFSFIGYKTQEIKIEKAPVDNSTVGSSMELFEKMAGVKSDAPLCMTCGVKMRMAGSCFVCEGCGNTSGCS